jgi:ferrous iron transport protein B
MDRAMRVVGLHGKSFLPLLLGFGCTVPAVYATRTLEHARDRRLTAFLTTFMSCSARLPVYMVFAAAFFGARAGTVLFALYLTGIAAALATGMIVRHTLHRRQPPQPFVLELPPYRMPHLRTVARQVYDRTRGFVRRAGTVILASAVLVWLLLATPRAPGLGGFDHVAPHDSLFGAVSGAVAPLLAPAGFGTWEAAGSLLTGIVAKEVVLGTLSQVYGTGDAGLGAALQHAFSPAAALAFLLFVLLYSPCVSALAAQRHEFGARFAWTQALYTTALAWAVAVLAYQVLSRLGVGL